VGWFDWLEFALTVLVAVLAVAWLWARRYERRVQEADRRRREQRLAQWRLVEWPESPQTFPEPGTTSLDAELASHLADSDEFEQLRRLFGGYFHQDYDLMYDDEDGVLRGYVEEHLPQDVVSTLRALDKLLAFGLTDHDLRDALFALGSDYAAADTNVWLRSLRAKLLAETRGG